MLLHTDHRVNIRIQLHKSFSWGLAEFLSTGRSNGVRQDRQRGHFFPAQLLADEVFLLPKLGREVGAEVFHLVKGTNFDLRALVERSSLEPLDSFIDGLNAPYPVARDQLLRLGKSIFSPSLKFGFCKLSLVCRMGT